MRNTNHGPVYLIAGMLYLEWDPLPSPVLPSLPLPYETFQGRSMNEAEDILEVLAYMGIPLLKYS